MTTYNARLKEVELISAKEFVVRHDRDPKSVEGARLIVPKFGEREFGRFEVRRQAQTYEVLADER